MATHSSVLAWRVPGMGKPGGLPSVGSHRVGLKRLSSSSSSPYKQGFPGGSDSKESVCKVGDLGSIPGSGRSPGEGNGNPFQYSSLENPMDGGA